MIGRRTFVTGLVAVAASPVLAGAGAAYKPGLVTRELAEGKTVLIDFYTDWCTTCRAQERIINALQAENPAYAEQISFIAVDWDQYSGSDLARSLNIPRRSTLVAIKGQTELGRLVADTRAASIKALLDTALNAAMS